jgi:hypothetical protein
MNRVQQHVSGTLVLSGTAAGLALMALYFFEPGKTPIYPVCVLYQVTGLACPGCGSLRAIHNLLRGDVVAAFLLNPLLLLSVPALAWLGVRWLRRVRSPKKPHPPLVPPRVAWTALGIMVVFAVLRNLPAFSWMAP